MWGLFVCRKCIVCTEVQCENSVQCCEWAGRYFMNGGGIMWPQHLPKQIFLTDCQQAHTRDRLIEKQQHTHIHAKCDLKMGATSTNRHLTHGLKNRHPRIVRDLGVKETPFFRKNAFLWMEIVICKWVRLIKNGIFRPFSTPIESQSHHMCLYVKNETLALAKNELCRTLNHDFIRKSWSTL